MNNRPSQLGELPTDWARKKLGAITKVRQGLQIAISDRLTAPTSESKEYITIQSINKKDQAREYIHAPSKRVICNPDDVLMTRTGNTGIVVTGVDGVFHNNFFLIDFDRKLIDGSYLVEYLRTRRVQYLILTKAGTSTIPDLNHKDFYSIEFPVPPFPEQKKIAQILSTWDKAIATTEKLLENSQKQKQALMQQLLTGKKRFSGFSGEWKTLMIGEISEIGSGISKMHLINESGNRYILDMGSVSREGKLIPSKKTNSNEGLLKRGQLIMPKDDIGGGNIIGRVGYVPEDGKFILSDHVYALTIKGHDSLFISYLINSHLVNKSLRRKANGTAQLGLGKKDVLKQKVNLPPSIDEQQKVALVLNKSDQEIINLQTKLDLLKNEKKALMQQLLTGKKRVKLEG